MIFVTIGTQLPFNRLIKSLDEWAGQNTKVNVFAQIGAGSYTPTNMHWVRDMTPQGFQHRLEACDLVVAHAGMGSIISALDLGKRVIIMPRQAKFGEHRNDHQLATAKRLEHLNGLTVVHGHESLCEALNRPVETQRDVSVSGPKPELISAIRKFSGLEAA